MLDAGRPVRQRYAGGTATLQRCRHCGHIFFDPLPDDETLRRFYESDYIEESPDYYTIERDYRPELHREVVAEAVELLRRHGLSGPVHDVGCGFGGLVAALRERGLDATGSDFNRVAIAGGQEHGNSSLWVGGLSEDPEPDRLYSLIIFQDCLEHLSRPGDGLRRAVARLEPGGLILARVPNGLYLPAQRRSFLDFDWFGYPWHLHYFTPRSLARLFEGQGLEVSSISCTSCEKQLPLLLDCVVGAGREELPEPDALVEALRRNLLLRELKIVARRPDSSDVPRASGWASAPFGLGPWTGGIPRDEDVALMGSEQPWTFHWSEAPPRLDGKLELDDTGFATYRGPDPYCLLQAGFSHPDRTSPIRVWRAAKAGVVRVTGELWVMDARATGVRFRLFRDETELLEQVIGGGEAPWRFERYVRVLAGTTLRFAIEMVETNAFAGTRTRFRVEALEVD